MTAGKVHKYIFKMLHADLIIIKIVVTHWACYMSVGK